MKYARIQLPVKWEDNVGIYERKKIEYSEKINEYTEGLGVCKGGMPQYDL